MTQQKQKPDSGEGTAERKPRTSVGELAKLLAERRAAGSSSVTVKVSAQGVFMPEVTIVANEDDETIDRMVEQATDAYTKLLAASKPAD